MLENVNIANFQVEITNLKYQSNYLLSFFALASEKLGYNIVWADENCLTAKLEEKPPKEIAELIGFDNWLKYAYSMPLMFKVCIEGGIAKLDFNFFENLGIFRNKKSLIARINNFLEKIYQLHNHIEEADVFSYNFKNNVEFAEGESPFFTVLLSIVFLGYYLFIVLIKGANFFEVDPDTLINSGGNFATHTLNGEWWRLLTSIFLHGSLEHLFANIAALISIGTLLEPRIGHIRLLLGFLVTGVIGASISTMNNHFEVSIGASGGILGLYAIFFVLLAFRVVKIRKKFFYDLLILVVFTLASGLVDPEIDNSGHFGGFFSGVVVGFVFLFDFKKGFVKRTFATILVPCILALIVPIYVLKTTPDYRARWLSVLRQSDSIGNSSQSFFEILIKNPDVPDEVYLDAIRDDLRKREKALLLLKSADSFKLNSFQRNLSNYLKEYNSTWIKAYKFLEILFSNQQGITGVEDSLESVFLKLTEIIKKDTIVEIPEVWIPHNMIYLFRINKFNDLEKQALSYYELVESNSSKEDLIYALEDGNLKWTYCQNLLKDLDSLNIAPSFKAKIPLLKEYLKLRIDSYNALLRYYKNDSPEALNLYKVYEEKINQVRNKLNEIR